jgi:hypothetical protein
VLGTFGTGQAVQGARRSRRDVHRRSRATVLSHRTIGGTATVPMPVEPGPRWQRCCASTEAARACDPGCAVEARRDSMGLRVSAREPGPPRGLGACTTRIERLRIAGLANLWAESRGMPSQIALLAEVEIGPFLDDQGRFAPERAGSKLVRRAARVPALTRRVLWTRPVRVDRCGCATRCSIRGATWRAAVCDREEDLLVGPSWWMVGGCRVRRAARPHLLRSNRWGTAGPRRARRSGCRRRGRRTPGCRIRRRAGRGPRRRRGRRAR